MSATTKQEGHPMAKPQIRTLSLGAGVQSTAVALLAAEGIIPTFDAAIFADTGWEPAQVYTHLDKLEAEVLKPAGIPLYRVSAGNIRNDALDPDHRFASMPLFVKNQDGGDGMARRQCTSEYKLKPIKAKVRELLGYVHPKPVPRGVVAEQAIGISTDEIGRAKDSGIGYLRSVFPLLELDMSRLACEDYLRSRGWGEVEKSACIGCPFHGNAQWRHIRDTCACGHHRDDHWRDGVGGDRHCAYVLNRVEGPDAPAEVCLCSGFSAPEWADAVEFDRAIRGGSARANAAGKELRGQMFLHRSRQRGREGVARPDVPAPVACPPRPGTHRPDQPPRQRQHPAHPQGPGRPRRTVRTRRPRRLLALGVPLRRTDHAMTAPLPPHIAAWIDEAVPDGTDTPCGHYNAAANTTCRATPTRQYMGGRRCWHHTPDKTDKKGTQ